MDSRDAGPHWSNSMALHSIWKEILTTISLQPTNNRLAKSEEFSPVDSKAQLELELVLGSIPVSALWRQSSGIWRELRVSVLFISDTGDLCYQQGE